MLQLATRQRSRYSVVHPNNTNRYLMMDVEILKIPKGVAY
jgi:hypothetical protein